MNSDAPDLSLFQLHLGEAPFLTGAEAGRWGLLEGETMSAWPLCLIWVRCDARYSKEARVVLRFDFDNYPAAAPTSQPWDAEKNVGLERDRWPKGTVQINAVFNPNWKTTALYMPCDRVAMDKHEPWKVTFARWWWTPQHTITDYLTFIFRCLNPACDD